MRIAVWYNLPSGGAKRALYDQVRGLLARGHELEAWCPDTADAEYLPLGEIIQENRLPLDASVPSHPLRRLPGSVHKNTGARIEEIAAMEAFSRKCAAQIQAGGFDLLFAHPCRFMYAPFVGRYLDIPKVMYLQEPNRALYEASPRLPWTAREVAEEQRRQPWWNPRQVMSYYRENMDLQVMRIKAREERMNAAAYDRILVNSYFSRESLLRSYGTEAEVCYLGVDNVKFQNFGRSRQPVVISVGSFAAPKGIHFVIESLARIPITKRPELVWIGNSTWGSPYLSQMEELAKKVGVHFTPLIAVSDEEIVRRLNEASVMVYAPRLEPFGYAPLEANACGLPVVAIAEGGVRETVVDGINGLVVDPDPQAMADAVLHLLENPFIARKLGEQGERLVAEKWTIDTAVERLERILLKQAGKARREQLLAAA